VSRHDAEGAAVLLLFGLTELSGGAGGEAEAVEDVLMALMRAANSGIDTGKMCNVEMGCVPPGLRAYGALALVVVAVDFHEALRRSPTGTAQISEVHLPSCASPRALAALAGSPAMQWPASDTGGIAFAEVVEGRADAAEAMRCWLLAFFAARHRRLLEPPCGTGAGRAASDLAAGASSAASTANLERE